MSQGLHLKREKELQELVNETKKEQLELGTEPGVSYTLGSNSYIFIEHSHKNFLSDEKASI